MRFLTRFPPLDVALLAQPRLFVLPQEDPRRPRLLVRRAVDDTCFSKTTQFLFAFFLSCLSRACLGKPMQRCPWKVEESGGEKAAVLSCSPKQSVHASRPFLFLINAWTSSSIRTFSCCQSSNGTSSVSCASIRSCDKHGDQNTVTKTR